MAVCQMDGVPTEGTTQGIIQGRAIPGPICPILDVPTNDFGSSYYDDSIVG